MREERVGWVDGESEGALSVEKHVDKSSKRELEGRKQMKRGDQVKAKGMRCSRG